MMMVGVILRKTKIITDEVNRGLSNILMNVALPCMILYSFNFKFSTNMFKGAVMIFLYSALIHIALIILSQIFYYKFKDSEKNVYTFATVFSNCGFVGYPVIQGIYGSVGVFYTSIFTIPFNLFMYSYGVMLFTGEKDFKNMKKNLINMPLICILLGTIIFLFSIRLPELVINTLGSIGNMTTPLSMFIIGAMLADVSVKDVFKDLTIYYVNFIKLIAAPILIYFALKFLAADKTLLYICVILVSMPTASLIGVLAERYNVNKAIASKCAFLTTIMSLFTIPAVMSLMDFLTK